MQMISVDRSIDWEVEKCRSGVVERDAISKVIYRAETETRDHDPELQLGFTVQLGGHHPRELSVVYWH